MPTYANNIQTNNIWTNNTETKTVYCNNTLVFSKTPKPDPHWETIYTGGNNNVSGSKGFILYDYGNSWDFAASGYLGTNVPRASQGGATDIYCKFNMDVTGVQKLRFYCHVGNSSSTTRYSLISPVNSSITDIPVGGSGVTLEVYPELDVSVLSGVQTFTIIFSRTSSSGGATTAINSMTALVE